MKKMMFVAVAHLVLSANCAVEVVDGIEWNYRIVDGKAELIIREDTGISIPRETNGDVTIPNSLGRCPLTRIGSGCFFGCTGLTSITIPEGVEIIDDYAFFHCTSLTNVTIPSSVVSIKEAAFGDCEGLASIEIPEKLTDISLPFATGKLKAIKVAEDNSRYFAHHGSLYEKTGPLLVEVPEMIESFVFHPETTGIGNSAFSSQKSVAFVDIPSTVTHIEDFAFSSAGPMSVKIPTSVASIGKYVFYNFKGEVVFEGNPPETITSLMIDKSIVKFPRKFAGEWQKLGYGPENYFGKRAPVVKVLSTRMREADPTIMDIEYKVVSASPNVRVRMLAFKDCIRSFANVIRAETFVDGTDVNVGDSVAANVVHKLAWKVSADYGKDLTKMCVEILAREDDLLPMSWIWIPKSDSFGKMRVSYNMITEKQVFDALMWLYADKDYGLSLHGGSLLGDGVCLVCGTEFFRDMKFDYREAATRYVFQKMNWRVLSGSVLSYVNAETRKGFVPGGIQQYAFQIVEE